MNKEIYYYIDEAGSINGDTNSFILGCYITDTPSILRNKLESLKNSIIEDPYFATEMEKFIKYGFHACQNSFDIRTKFYSILPILNYRSYILVLQKNSEYFKKLIQKGFTDIQIYDRCINKLLFDRLQKNRNEKNFLIFEQFGNKNQKRESEIKVIIESIKSKINIKHSVNIDYELFVKDKSEILLSIIDYINYIFFQAFEQKINPRMIDNYKLIQPNIGLIYIMDRDLFYHRNNKLSIENLKL